MKYAINDRCNYHDSCRPRECDRRTDIVQHQTDDFDGEIHDAAQSNVRQKSNNTVHASYKKATGELTNASSEQTTFGRFSMQNICKFIILT